MPDHIFSPPHRPRGPLVLVTLLALFQTGAAWQTVTVPTILTAPINLSLPLELAASLFWVVASVWVGRTLWQRQPRARIYTAGLLLGFTLYSLLRLAVFAQADYDRQRLPFLVIITVFILMILLAYIVYSIQRPVTTEKTLNGRKSED